MAGLERPKHKAILEVTGYDLLVEMDLKWSTEVEEYMFLTPNTDLPGTDRDYDLWEAKEVAMDETSAQVR